MLIKKIITNNFVYPGEQIFEFDLNNNLIGGSFYGKDGLIDLFELLNGDWREYNLSFEKWYPKFTKKVPNMDLNIDALVMLTDEELEKLNSIINNNNFKNQKSNIWFFSIKCVYPYIFPIVTLVPAIDKLKDDVIALGSHYEKFYRDLYSKREMIITKIISALGDLRKEYFDPTIINEKTNKKIHDAIFSILRFDTIFIKKLAKLTISLPEEELIHFGYEKDYFFMSNEINEFVDSLEGFSGDEELRVDFLEIIWKYYFRDLQYMFGTRSSVDIYEVRQILKSNFCERAISQKELFEIFTFISPESRITTKGSFTNLKLTHEQRSVLANERENSFNIFGKDEELDVAEKIREREKQKRKEEAIRIMQEKKSKKVKKEKKAKNEKTLDKDSKASSISKNKKLTGEEIDQLIKMHFKNNNPPRRNSKIDPEKINDIRKNRKFK